MTSMSAASVSTMFHHLTSDVYRKSKSFVIELLQPFPVFTVINILMFWLFIVLVDCTITIALGSDFYRLLVIYNPSDTISTPLMLFLLIFHLPVSFLQEWDCFAFPRPRKTSYHFNVTQTPLTCIPRYYLIHWPWHTAFYRVTSIFLWFSSCFIDNHYSKRFIVRWCRLALGSLEAEQGSWRRVKENYPKKCIMS